MKKAFVLGLGLVLGVLSNHACADNIRPAGGFFNDVYLAVWAAYEVPGYIYDKVKCQLNRYNVILDGAQRYLKNSCSGVWRRTDVGWYITICNHDQVAADFVAQEYAKDGQPDVQALLRAVFAQKNTDGVICTHKALTDIKAGLNNVVVALEGILPRLWRSSIIEKYRECLADARKQCVFVEKLLLLVEQSEVYKAQLRHVRC